MAHLGLSFLIKNLCTFCALLFFFAKLQKFATKKLHKHQMVDGKMDEI
jgi:hypothetical protein